ncbi:MAG: efflux RND transporter permease subunit, partial [Actinobacteria bacterium]|nr:efflux RND transporter permease subunit [Actinomycetota bacterium]
MTALDQYASVHYLVEDVQAAVDFYTGHLGFTLNTMSLLGLSLAIGILIDDAIVVRENIVRHVEMGKDHYTAAREGTDEIGLAVAATTFSIVAVFVPVGFMYGVAGQWFKPFALTIACAVLVSLLVSF